MITNDITLCPQCGGALKATGKVKRIIKKKSGVIEWFYIRRLLCVRCGKVHREIPNYIVPYKHYEKEIIQSVINDLITPDDLEYEDYPCEMTMKRWKKDI